MWVMVTMEHWLDLNWETYMGKKGKLAFIDSLTYTISDDVPWDINIDGKLQELPMGIDVAIGFKVLDDTRPEYKEDAPAIYDWKFKK